MPSHLGASVNKRIKELFLLNLVELGIPEPIPNSKNPKELIFHPTRKWRFDFAWPEQKIALEIDGAVHQGGRHTQGVGFVKDCEKMNEATILGWQVYRVPTDWIYNGQAYELLQRAFGLDEIEEVEWEEE